jgi:hypothetical protein
MTVKTSDPAVQTALTAAPAQTASPLGATSAQTVTAAPMMTTSSLGSTSTQTASLIDWNAQAPVADKDRKIAPLTTSDALDWYLELESVQA